MEQHIPFRRWFGDFGGGFCADDITNYDQEQYAKRLAHYLGSSEFRSLFHRMLNLLLPHAESSICCCDLEGGRRLYLARNLSWYYNLAGQLALAQLEGKQKLCTGTRVREECRIVAKAAQALEMQLTIVLSREQSEDTDLINELTHLGCTVDSTTCVKWPDFPYAYAMYHCESSPDVYVLALEANFGCYPYPSLVGLLAGEFGKQLYSQAAGLPIEGIVVPIITGTEAVGAFHPWVDAGTNISLMTVEQPICEEYHVTDMGTYTLSTRSAEQEQSNTSLCPELVSWWRGAKVSRLGCDHYKKVETGWLACTDLTPAGARAAALAFAQSQCSSLLILEVYYG